MKKKIIIASATVLFAVATVFNLNLLQENSVGDVSLDAIAVMAQAQNETPSGGNQPNNKSETVATKKITTYYKWDVKASAWIITFSIGEAGRTEETSYSYPCCVSNLGQYCGVGVDC